VLGKTFECKRVGGKNLRLASIANGPEWNEGFRVEPCHAPVEPLVRFQGAFDKAQGWVSRNGVLGDRFRSGRERLGEPKTKVFEIDSVDVLPRKGLGDPPHSR